MPSQVAPRLVFVHAHPDDESLCDGPATADSVRNGADVQVAHLHAGAAAFAQFSAVSNVRTARIVTPPCDAADTAGAAAYWRIPQCARRFWACSTPICWPRWAPATTTPSRSRRRRSALPVRPGLRAHRATGARPGAGAGIVGRRRLRTRARGGD